MRAWEILENRNPPLKPVTIRTLHKLKNQKKLTAQRDQERLAQAMPEAEMQRAKEESVACGLFLAIGSSLVVYPAAGFPVLAKDSGAALVIINREPTEHDHLADLVINAEIGPTLDAAVNGSN